MLVYIHHKAGALVGALESCRDTPRQGGVVALGLLVAVLHEGLVDGRGSAGRLDQGRTLVQQSCQVEQLRR